MPTIAVLTRDSVLIEDVSGQLALVATVEQYRDADALVERATSDGVDAVVTELHDENGRSIAPTVVELAARRPRTPIVLYARVNGATITSLLAALTTGVYMECAVRAHERLDVVMRRVLSPDFRPSAAAPLLQHFVPLAPATLRTFVALAVLVAPSRRGVDEVSRWSGSTARTIDRRLARAHWPSAHTVLQSFVALDAVWLMTEYGWSARRVQRVRGFPHESSITRLLARYAGTRPSTLREDGGFAMALAHVTEALTRAPDR